MAAIPSGFSCYFSMLVLEGDNAATSHSSVTARPLVNVSLGKDFYVFLEIGIEIADSHK